jgi:hypothetical protein
MVGVADRIAETTEVGGRWTLVPRLAGDDSCQDSGHSPLSTFVIPQNGSRMTHLVRGPAGITRNNRESAAVSEQRGIEGVAWWAAQHGANLMQLKKYRELSSVSIP